MSQPKIIGDRLRRATQLWHAHLAVTGRRFELPQFLNDPAIEKQVLAGALASGDPQLVALAQDWLLEMVQAKPAVVASRAAPAAPSAPAAPPKAPLPDRYLRGVR